jgi:hypothetical protein
VGTKVHHCDVARDCEDPSRSSVTLLGCGSSRTDESVKRRSSAHRERLVVPARVKGEMPQQLTP